MLHGVTAKWHCNFRSEIPQSFERPESFNLQIASTLMSGPGERTADRVLVTNGVLPNRHKLRCMKYATIDTHTQTNDQVKSECEPKTSFI